MGRRLNQMGKHLGGREDVARLAERGCLDMIFSGDGTDVSASWRGSRDATVEWGVNWPHALCRRLEAQPDGIRAKNGVRLASTNSTTAGNHLREQVQQLLQSLQRSGWSRRCSASN